MAQRAPGGQTWAAGLTVEVRKPTQRSARVRGVWREHIRKNPNREWLGFEFWWWVSDITYIHTQEGFLFLAGLVRTQHCWLVDV